MEALQVAAPAWMTEDLVLLEEQARRFLATELVPHVENWNEDGIMDRSAWDKLGQAGLLLRRRSRKNTAAPAAPSRMRR